MHEDIEKAFSNIDAGLFSSDTFLNDESLERLNYYLKRWSEEAEYCREHIDAMIKDD